MPIIVASNSGPSSLTISQDFAWNIEQYISVDKMFEWWVGEGPLFWYKIEWKNPLCPPGNCTPSISTCTIADSDCGHCTPPIPSCVPGQCQICEQCEVWHVQATSVVDLCRRLNRECCNRNLYGKKVFKNVYKYDRPVLCCDVDRYILSGIPISDTYVSVDFCECECISWVDPCDCGTITVPCDDDVPFAPCKAPSVLNQLSTSILFGLPKIVVDTKPGFNIDNIKVMRPKVDIISTKFGMFPSNLKLNHNLKRTSVLKEFLFRNKLNLPENIDIIYNKSSNSWQKVIHLSGHEEDWTITFSLISTEEGLKSDTHISKKMGSKKQNARVVAIFASHAKLEGINFNYNTKTGKIDTEQQISVKSKSVNDEIGLFRGKDPCFVLNISVDKKG